MGAPPTRRRPGCHKPRGGSALNSSCAMYTDTPSPAAPCDGECVALCRRIFAENERCTNTPRVDEWAWRESPCPSLSPSRGG